MAASITHAAVVVVADDGTSPVGTNEWNAAHSITGTIDPANGGTGAGAFTAGSIVFAGASGVYAQDNTNFFWDNTAKALNIAGKIYLTGADLTGALEVVSTRSDYIARFRSTTNDNYNQFATANCTGEYGLWTTSFYFQAFASCLNGLQFSTDQGAAIVTNGRHITLNSHATGYVEQVSAGAGATAQQYQVYNTLYSATNYERGVFGFKSTASVLSVGTEKGGTGIIRGMQFLIGGANALDYGVSNAGRWTLQAPLAGIAGTTTAAPFIIPPASSLLTTAAAGAIEQDGKAFYATSVASSRQVIDAEQVLIQNATRTFTANTNPQAIFNASANGAITLAGATTYEFEMQIAATGFSASAHTFNLSFLGTATFNSIGYYYDAQAGSTPATPAASLTGFVAVATASAVTASATTTGLILYVRGTMRINAGGTVIPTLTQVTNGAAGVVQINSFFRCWPVGLNTVTNVGNWS